jgi:hypothetical protein
MNTLDFRGEISKSIITILFTDYMVCIDKKFVVNMEIYKDSYEAGEDITYQAITLKAERKYQARVMSNKWNTLTSKK